MKNDKTFDDKRLLGVLDGVDQKFIAEALESYDTAEPQKIRKAPIYRRVAILAACLLLITAAFPIVHYVLPRFGITVGGNAGAGTSEVETPTKTPPPTEFSGSNSNVVGAGYYLYGSDMYYQAVYALRRCNTETMEIGRVCECDEEGCLSNFAYELAGIYDDKLYYIGQTDRGTISYLDLKTMETVKIFKIPFYSAGEKMGVSVYDGYVYYTRYDSYSNPTMCLYRVSVAGGEEEKLLECEGEKLQLIADGHIITRKDIREGVHPNEVTKHESEICSYNIETLQRKTLWSTVGSEFYSSPSYIQYLNGRLYFISFWAKERASHSDGVRKLISLDVNTGDYKYLIENSVYNFFLMNDCIYYFPYEMRTVNYTDYFASYAPCPDYRTYYGTSIHLCDLNGENDTVVYENSEFAYYYPKIIKGKLFDERMMGDFSELGLKKSCISAVIDLSTDKMQLIDILIQQNEN